MGEMLQHAYMIKEQKTNFEPRKENLNGVV